MKASTWPRRRAGRTLKKAPKAALVTPRCVTCWPKRTSMARRGREAHDPDPEASQVHERQGQRHRRDAEARVQAIGQQRADEERSDGHRGVEQRQDGEQLGLVRVGRLHRREEGELEAEEQHGQQHVGDGHEAHER